MSSDTYTVDVHPNAAREFQRLSEDARAFVRANAIEWAERNAQLIDAGVRPEFHPHRKSVIAYTSREKDTYGISGVVVEIDYPNKRITITGLSF